MFQCLPSFLILGYYCYLDKKELQNSLVLLKFKRDVTERDYKILSCYVYCVWRVRNECKHGRDVDPFEIFKILFNKFSKRSKEFVSEYTL